MIAYTLFTFLIQYLTDQAEKVAQENKQNWRKNGKIKQNLQKRL